MFAKPLADGSWAIGLLNRHDTEDKTIRINWNELEIDGKWRVRDLWNHKELGPFRDYFESIVMPHQCVVIRISKNL